MNKIESLVYSFVKKNQRLKNVMRNIYQSFFDLLPRKSEFFADVYDYKENYFFGFHDVSPFSSDNSKVLANHLLFDLRMPKQNDSIEVGFFSFDGSSLGDYHKISESYAWNYHKGCRLQWLNDKQVIFNTFDNGLCSKIIDIDSLEENEIRYPIDSVSHNGNYATSFSYERLQKFMPGYGYDYDDCGFCNENAPKDTGLFLIDLKKNERQMLLSLNQLSVDIDPQFEKQHYVTHSEFSRDGRFVSCLHRYITDDIENRWTRLVVFNLETRKYFFLPTQGMVSHYVWNSKNQIIAYCRIDGIDRHVVFNIPDVDDYKIVAQNALNSDGHQSVIDDNMFVTDTYPDKYRMNSIFKVDILNDTVKQICNVYSPKTFQTKNSYKHIACDLHPRCSSEGRYVCFDSPRTGKRAVYVMKMPDNC